VGWRNEDSKIWRYGSSFLNTKTNKQMKMHTNRKVIKCRCGEEVDQPIKTKSIPNSELKSPEPIMCCSSKLIG
jgi:hypothetical protein